MKIFPKTSPEPSPHSLRDTVRAFERTLIHATLVACDWNQRKACEVLDVLPTTLSEKIRRFDLRPPEAPKTRTRKASPSVLVPTIQITRP